MRLITDARALRTQFVPKELQHREGAIDQLSAALNPITHSEPGADTFISGPPGSGKTTLAKFVAEQLEREALAYRWGYVNCLSRDSRSQVLFKLAKDAGVASDLRLQGTAPTVFRDRLADQLDKEFVAIVDEVNVLEDLATLVELDTIPNVTLVLICVDENDFYADADGTVLSRFRGAVKVSLDRYSDVQLMDILRNRVEHGLVSGVVREEEIEAIAREAAGDARHGIVLLRKAVLRVQDRGQDHVTVEDVEAVADDAREEIVERYLSSLNTDMQLLFKLIREHGPISATDLRERYETQVADPVSDSARGKYLRELQRHGRIEKEGTGKGATYRASERSLSATPR